MWETLQTTTMELSYELKDGWLDSVHCKLVMIPLIYVIQLLPKGRKEIEL